MSEERKYRGQSRERLLAATLRAVAATGPAAVSGRAVARDAGVHHPQIQQMFGSVDVMVNAALLAERNRFMAQVFEDADGLPDPLAIARFPDFWRAITQVLLDPGPVALQTLADGGPVAVLTERMRVHTPLADDGLHLGVASAWAAAPLGALVFVEPLRRGLGIGGRQWPACWRRLGSRLRELAELSDLAIPSGLGVAVRPPSHRPSALSHGRDRLVAAAEELLATRLETAVRGRELAAHAGVNYGLVSHYFGSKSAVFDEALVGLHQRFLADVLASEQDRFGAGVHEVFFRHRPFLRAWASRLLGGRDVPEFKLVGMQKLIEQLADSRGIGPADRARMTEASGDALAAVALQLGWTLLQPLPSAADGSSEDPVMPWLQAVHRWLLQEPGSGRARS